MDVRPRKMGAALETYIKGQGFSINTSGICWYAYKDLAPDVAHHDKDRIPVRVIVTPAPPEQVDIELTGEVHGQWYSFRCICIPSEVCMQDLPHIEASLIKAWNAVVEKGESWN